MVDVYGGSGIVAINCNNKSIVYNDKFKGVYNFFYILRKYEDILVKLIQLTPYSQQEYVKCRDNWRDEEDNIEKARMFYVATMQSRDAVGAMKFQKIDWRRSTNICRRGMTQAVSSWRTNVEQNLPSIVEKLKCMQIENMDAIECIKKYDGKNVIFYLDPPYLEESRVITGVYECEYTYEQHEELIKILKNIKGSYILSGYNNELYDQLLENNCKKKIFKGIKKTSSNGFNGKKPSVEEVVWYKI